MGDVKYEYGCEITSTTECPLREKIRADAIEELIKHFEEHHIFVFDKNEIIDELEQLKEQNK